MRQAPRGKVDILRPAGNSGWTATHINQSLTKRSHPQTISIRNGAAAVVTAGRLRLIRFFSIFDGFHMAADSNSSIAWHRVQLRKNRDLLKEMEVARFRIGKIKGTTGAPDQEAIASLKRKIAESEHCIAAYERQIRRPLATDLGSLTQVSWSKWNTYGLARS